jgi:HSP20 family protein
MTNPLPVKPAKWRTGPLDQPETATNPNQPNTMNTLSTFNPFRSTNWDPFRDFGNFESRLEKFFGRPQLTGNGGDKESMTVTQWSPLVDITEDDKEYVVTAELPEIKKEDVKVTVENGQLTISGERKFEKEEKGKKYHRIERAYGNFTRSFTLPEAVKADKVSAEFKDGLLHVRMPKDESAKPKSIAIKVA